MELGSFSVSLAVKDLEASRRLYEKFGLHAIRATGIEASVAADTRAYSIIPSRGE